VNSGHGYGYDGADMIEGRVAVECITVDAKLACSPTISRRASFSIYHRYQRIVDMTWHDHDHDGIE
jgi:2,3-bisphosphoglycerate-independent phosphoglycerate mutase